MEHFLRKKFGGISLVMFSKIVEPLVGCIIARCARIRVTDKHTDTQDNYFSCACLPSVYKVYFLLTTLAMHMYVRSLHMILIARKIEKYKYAMITKGWRQFSEISKQTLSIKIRTEFQDKQLL